MTLACIITLRGQHLVAMKELRQKFSIDEKYTHVQEGLPEKIIPEMCEELNAGVVVLGIIGRTGLSAAFLGNTAEHVVDKLNVIYWLSSPMVLSAQ